MITRPVLPELPLTEWEETKDTLHLWVQIVGKVRMASTAPRNHWWHVPLYVDVRGLTTRRMHAPSGVTFQIDFDFIDHRLVIATNGGELESFDLTDGLSVAEFDAELNASAAETRGLFGVLGTRRVLTLGVPLLGTLSREELMAVIAHEYGHFSRRHGRLGHWLYRARVGWLRYAEHVDESDSTFYRAAAWYAARFVPYFSARSFVHSRQCEYER